MSSIVRPSFSEVHFVRMDGAVDMEGALVNGSAPAVGCREPSNGSPIGTAPTFRSIGVDKGLDTCPGTDPEVVEGGTAAEAHMLEERQSYQIEFWKNLVSKPNKTKQN